MTSVNLPNKPLVEALLEVRWALSAIPKSNGLQQIPANFVVDPNYKLALGRFFTAIERELPHYEQLPSASIPDELAASVVQHRFRAGEDSWPLAQLGPGILTFNDTEGYDWPKFRDGAKAVVEALRSSYPPTAAPVINQVVLKYIDAVPFDFFEESVFGFLAKLKVDAKLQSEFLKELGVDQKPMSFIWRTGYRSSNPMGEVQIQIATATKGEQRAVMWETTIASSNLDAPKDEHALETWLESAHLTSSAIFRKMTEGELYDSFL